MGLNGRWADPLQAIRGIPGSLNVSYPQHDVGRDHGPRERRVRDMCRSPCLSTKVDTALEVN